MKKILIRANRTCARDISPKWTPPALRGRLEASPLRAEGTLGWMAVGRSGTACSAAFEGRQVQGGGVGQTAGPLESGHARSAHAEEENKEGRSPRCLHEPPLGHR